MNKNQTWRRVLSLLCAMVMLVGMMVVGTVVASAAEANVAEVNGVEYPTLADAIAVANAGDTVTLLANVRENVTVNKALTIEGAGFQYVGKLTVAGNAGTTDTVTFKNVKFLADASFGNSVSVNLERYAEASFVGCDFTGNSTAAYFGTYKGVTVGNDCTVSFKDCTASKLYYMVHISQGSTALTVENCTIDNTVYGIGAFKCTNVYVKNVTYTGMYAAINIRNSATCTLTLENVNLSPSVDGEYTVAMFKPDSGNASVQYNIVLKETENYADGVAMTLENVDQWLILQDPTNKYQVTQEITAEPVAKIGDVEYTSLQAALDKAVDGNTVTLIADVTLDKTIKENTYGYDTFLLVEGKEITLDLAGHTITVNPSESGTNNSYLESVLFLGKGANVTITGDGKIDVKSSIDAGADAIYSLFYNSKSTLVVENGTYNVKETATKGAIFYADAENHTEIRGGIYTLGNEGSGDPDNGYKPWISNVEGKNSGNFIIYMGGTFNQNPLMNDNSLRDFEIEIPEGYVVIDNGNDTWSVIKAVAQVNGKIYPSLKAAITAATAGDTIELLADVNENVTVNKNLIIDGQNKNYTGTMTVNNISSLTIQNLNFIKGQVSKGKSTGTSAVITIKNCNFDGKGLSAYALNLRGTAGIVLDTVTAKNYGYGLLQVPSSCAGLTVKNVTVSDCYYAFKIDYANSPVTFENVVIEDTCTLGIYDSNYGTKTYNITNCTLNAQTPIKLWQRNTTIYTTFKFFGTNEANGLSANSNYMRFELAEGATVKAAADTADFTTKVADYVAVYHAGSYVLTHKVGLTGALELGNTIDVHFGVKGSDLSEGLTVVVTYGEDEYVLTANNNGKFVFANVLTAKQMADELTVVVKFSDGTAVSEVKTFSIKGYADIILADTTNAKYTVEDQNLVKAMLHYGEAAQNAFNYNADKNLIDGANVADVAPENTYDDPMNYYYGASLNLNNGIQFNFKFYYDRLVAAGVETLVVTNDKGEPLAKATLDDLVKDNKYTAYTVKVLNVDLSGANYGSLLTCTFYDATGKVVTYCADSVLGYCARALANAPETGKFNKAFYQALANYVDTVSKYTANKNGK